MHYELMLAARDNLVAGLNGDYPIAFENVPFTPPADGGMWIKFDYIEAQTDRYSLSRKCVSYIGMVQLSVIFPPMSGTEKARQLAKRIAEIFADGKMLTTGYIYSGGEVRPVQKSETGWLVPVRAYVRVD